MLTGIIESITIEVANKGYINEHLQPVVTLNLNWHEIPFVYQRIEFPEDDRILYYAQYEGIVSFYAHNPRNENGYGGATFDLTLTDGSRVGVKGPWSSRSSVMNMVFTPHSMEALIVTPQYPNSRAAGHVTVGTVAKAIGEADLPYELKLTRPEGSILKEIAYEIRSTS